MRVRLNRSAPEPFWLPPLYAIKQWLLICGGIWAEHDLDGGTVCCWDHFTISSIGERQLNRTHFFTDMIGECNRNASGSPGPSSILNRDYFAWTHLPIRLASAYPRVLTTQESPLQVTHFRRLWLTRAAPISPRRSTVPPNT